MRFLQRRKTPPDPSGPLTALPLARVILKYLEERKPFLQPTTQKNWRCAARRAAQAFPEPIEKLTDAKMWEYQKVRLKQGAATSTIQQEMFVFSMAMRRATAAFSPSIIERKQGPTIGKAISKADQRRLIEGSKPKPRLHLQILLGLEGLRISEIMNLRRRCWDGTILIIETSKTKAGERRIPLGEEARAALDERCAQIPNEPDRPIFTNSYEPGKPMSHSARAWTALRKDLSLTTVRFHDLRHTCITEMCEAGVPEAVIRAMVGHVDENMMRLYSHPRIEAMRDAVAARDRKQGGAQ